MKRLYVVCDRRPRHGWGNSGTVVESHFGSKAEAKKVRDVRNNGAWHDGCRFIVNVGVDHWRYREQMQ